MNEPICPDCRHSVPIVHSRNNPRHRWARHTQTGNLTSGDSPECTNSGKPWGTVDDLISDVRDYLKSVTEQTSWFCTVDDINGILDSYANPQVAG